MQNYKTSGLKKKSRDNRLMNIHDLMNKKK